jgi:hypothetical protein
MRSANECPHRRTHLPLDPLKRNADFRRNETPDPRNPSLADRRRQLPLFLRLTLAVAAEQDDDT